MFVVIVVCCEVEVSATGRSLVQRSPTDCGASLCVIKKFRDWGGPGPLGGCCPQNKKIIKMILGLLIILRGASHKALFKIACLPNPQRQRTTIWPSLRNRQNADLTTWNVAPQDVLKCARGHSWMGEKSCWLQFVLWGW